MQSWLHWVPAYITQTTQESMHEKKDMLAIPQRCRQVSTHPQAGCCCPPFASWLQRCQGLCPPPAGANPLGHEVTSEGAIADTSWVPMRPFPKATSRRSPASAATIAAPAALLVTAAGAPLVTPAPAARGLLVVAAPTCGIQQRCSLWSALPGNQPTFGAQGQH